MERTSEQDLPLHPVTTLLPPPAAEDIAYVRLHILNDEPIAPVVTSGGMVLDGQVRLALSQEMGVALDFDDVGELGAGEAVTLFVRLNQHRLDRLTAQQRAVWAAKALEHFRVDSKEQQREGGRRGGLRSAEVRRNTESPEDIVVKVSRHVVQQAIRNETAPQTSRDRAAEVYQVSSGYVARAKEVLDTSPETISHVAAGDISLKAAHDDVKRLRDTWKQQIAESPFARYLALAPNGITIAALTLAFTSPADATRILSELAASQQVVSIELKSKEDDLDAF